MNNHQNPPFAHLAIFPTTLSSPLGRQKLNFTNHLYLYKGLT
ncbi:hypothetical protein THERMOT_2121 [Bathymodiolus thermophilus thioautotrophic gill symbiont]|nr:hypothetical protein [Bathymodiolus thermophilus thioautotrophic gill symbiont]CAB5505245.1 hypothetical protein THERMOT_2121 [Bathymodiolus thermophilus thioautotrophic gill symbiont]